MKSYSHNLTEPLIYEGQETNSILETRFSLPVSVLTEALSRGQSSRNATTSFHPINAAGTYFYHEAIAAFRELSKLYGYDTLRDNNIEFTVNDKYAIFLCLGDKYVGNSLHMPTSQREADSRPKKQMFGLQYNNNPTGGQGEFFPKELIDASVQGREVWILLHYLEKVHNKETDETTYILKAELSRPRSLNKKGFIDSFSPRIILPAISFDPMPSLDKDQNDDEHFTQDIDIDIAKG